MNKIFILIVINIILHGCSFMQQNTKSNLLNKDQQNILYYEEDTLTSQILPKIYSIDIMICTEALYVIDKEVYINKQLFKYCDTTLLAKINSCISKINKILIYSEQEINPYIYVQVKREYGELILIIGYANSLRAGSGGSYDLEKQGDIYIIGKSRETWIQ
jgi:hypothetical protein